MTYIKSTISISLSVQIVIAPVIAKVYKTVSLTFLISNILSGFLISVIIIFGFAISVISLFWIDLARLLGIFYNLIINLLIKITEIVSKIPFSKVYVKTPYMYQIILYYILIFTLGYIIKKGKIQEILKYKKQIIAIILIIVLIPFALDIFPSRKFKNIFY